MAEVDGPQLVEHLKLLVGQVFVLDLCVMGDKGGMQERGVSAISDRLGCSFRPPAGGT
jgi:hypothetical protein